ncbi:LuxR C-terminal-related transcriptional regulator [Streptomyces sp. GLT-R25]
MLALLAQGHGLKVIADRLVLSRHTVRGHVKSVLVKLGAHSQLEAVVTATRLGILPRPTA